MVAAGTILRPPLKEHLWEVWHGENAELRGRLIVEWRAAQLPRLYEYYYKIEGREHIYVIVSHDAVTRDEAIWFAKQEYAGALRRININLKGVQP